MKLSFNHIKKNGENTGNIRFVVEEECPGSSAKIIYHGEKEPCTCEDWNFVRALNIHVQSSKQCVVCIVLVGKGNRDNLARGQTWHRDECKGKVLHMGKCKRVL